jgi:MFS transporter, FSR family, fosmidomycin resistance protein
MIQHLKKYKENYLLMLGHFATDICQGSLSAALAVMFAHGILHSNLEVSLLVLAATLISSIIQPVFGYISDLKPRPYLMGVGMLTAGLGLMFIGFFDSFYLLFALITIMGVGVAIFHPEGSKMANCVSSGANKGKGMSIFSVGGNLGFAVGPLLISGSTYLLGLPGILVIGIPAIITTIIYFCRNSKYVEYSNREIQKRKNEANEKESYSGFGLLTLMIFFRSVVLFGLTTFIPLYFMQRFELSAQTASINLTIIATCAAFASLIGGALADKIGFQKVQFYSSAIAVPCMIVFCLCGNYAAATIALIPVALSIYGTLSVSMVLGQKFLCNHVGFASGITIGLGITFGGITSPLLGYIGDNYGLVYTMWTICIAVVFTAIFAWFVPDIDKIRATAKANNIKNAS